MPLSGLSSLYSLPQTLCAHYRAKHTNYGRPSEPILDREEGFEETIGYGDGSGSFEEMDHDAATSVGPQVKSVALDSPNPHASPVAKIDDMGENIIRPISCKFYEGILSQVSLSIIHHESMTQLVCGACNSILEGNQFETIVKRVQRETSEG